MPLCVVKREEPLHVNCEVVGLLSQRRIVFSVGRSEVRCL